MRNGLSAHFLFVQRVNEISGLLEAPLARLGYELVDLEWLQGGRLVRVFIDKPGGVSVDDCAAASEQIAQLLAVEAIDFSRLEVSSPGLDRVVKKEKDFTRFAGETARVRLRVPVDGRRKFVGILRGVNDGVLQLEIDGLRVPFELSNLERVRLVPRI